MHCRAMTSHSNKAVSVAASPASPASSLHLLPVPLSLVRFNTIFLGSSQETGGMLTVPQKGLESVNICED